MPTHARARLLAAAEELFYAEGIRAVGVERLLSASGVGRASFYRHFAGKDELVVAMVQGYGVRFLDSLAQDVAARGGHPLAVFDALADRFERDDYRGCAAINTIIESADPESAAHRVAAAHKDDVVRYLTGLLTTAGSPRPAELADQFLLLIDGAIVTAQRERDARAAHRARTIAAALLPAAQPDSAG
ncbi:TetR/AcrR family transcriptional regulator [Streptomyces sp. NPDC127068]|uniref:TetR/AcrR family transcriptional regulator n=1 Tax=Streptomyces sp. NPDC127068 TaxID=3347127 RepID=UPI0036471D0C